MNIKRILLLSLLIFTLSACSPNPKDVASGYATTVQANQDAAQEELDRAIQKQQADYEAQRKEAAAAEFDKGVQTVIRYATFAGVLVVIALGVSLSITLKDIGQGMGKATVTAMDLKAHLIPLDPTTRQYPLLLQSIGKGRFSLTNPNTDSVLMLDTRKDADRLMVMSMARTQAVGSLARESRLSLRPGEVSQIDLPALDVDD